eukprot:350951-Chlamydomonas_euryale.AAC.4
MPFPGYQAACPESTRPARYFLPSSDALMPNALLPYVNSRVPPGSAQRAPYQAACPKTLHPPPSHPVACPEPQRPGALTPTDLLPHVNIHMPPCPARRATKLHAHSLHMPCPAACSGVHDPQHAACTHPRAACTHPNTVHAQSPPTVLCCAAQDEAAAAVVALLGCKHTAARSVLMFYRWDQERVASEEPHALPQHAPPACSTQKHGRQHRPVDCTDFGYMAIFAVPSPQDPDRRAHVTRTKPRLCGPSAARPLLQALVA